MTETPYLSIIVPCYGVEDYLDRCVDTLRRQSLKNIEIILVDDESPDRVPQMCEAYAQADTRIKVVHKKNGGLGFARNSGLDVASGKYVAFVDADDYVSTDMYRRLYRVAESTDADIVFCGFCQQHMAGGPFVKSSEVSGLTVCEGEAKRQFMLDMVASGHTEKQERKYYMSVWHSIYRKDIITQHAIRFLSEREVASEDLPFQIEAISAARKVVYVPDHLYFYCFNRRSLTSTFLPQKYQRFKHLCELLCQRYPHDEELHERLMRFFIGYTRTQLNHLAASGCKNKEKHLREIVDDHIWSALHKGYPPKMLRSLYQRTMYRLILGRRIKSLHALCMMVHFARTLKNRLTR